MLCELKYKGSSCVPCELKYNGGSCGSDSFNVRGTSFHWRQSDDSDQLLRPRLVTSIPTPSPNSEAGNETAATVPSSPATVYHQLMTTGGSIESVPTRHGLVTPIRDPSRQRQVCRAERGPRRSCGESFTISDTPDRLRPVASSPPRRDETTLQIRPPTSAASAAATSRIPMPRTQIPSPCRAATLFLIPARGL